MISHFLNSQNQIVPTTRLDDLGNGWVRDYRMLIAKLPGIVDSEARVQSMLNPDGSWKE